MMPFEPTWVTMLGTVAHDRERDRGHGHDGGECRVGQALCGHLQAVGRRRHRGRIVATDVGVVGLGHAQLTGGGVHLGHERSGAAGVPPGQGEGHVVGRSDQEPLEQLPFGQYLAHADRHGRLVGADIGAVLGHVLRGDGDRRAVCAHGQGMVLQDHHRNHHLGQAGHRNRNLGTGLGLIPERGDGHCPIAGRRPREDGRRAGHRHDRSGWCALLRGAAVGLPAPPPARQPPR